ncbi:MAG: beta-galactosidase GalB [Luteolibacter sp.]
MKKSLLPRLALFVSLAQSITPDHLAAAESPPRERILFTKDWRFHKGDSDGAGDSLKYGKLKPWLLPTAGDFVSAPPAKRPDGEAPGEKLDFTQAAFDDSQWRSLDLPHDWGIEGAFDQALPGETGKLPWFGVAWYRKSFDLTAADHGRRISLEIDGAMAYSAVWCNGRFVGGWPYGYASYRLDLTPYLEDGANSLAIRLDNPEQSSRWYPGGGIYRNVWLVKTSPVHVEPSGTVVTTPEISPESAAVEVLSKITNQSSEPAKVRVVTQIFKLSAAGVAEGSALFNSTPAALEVPAGGILPTTAKLKIAKPKLWSPSSPERYMAVTSVQQGNKTVDRFETPFGVRSFEFTADDGFHLNGKRVPLKGVCLHHDLGALGAAFNVRAATRQLEMLQEMGCNAIRTSHNPPAPEFLDLCDRMGFLVMDEFSDTWTRAKKPNGYAKLFNDWSEADVRAMVRRDRNHPSIVFWSIGNEIGEQEDPKYFPIAEKLRAIVHEEDPTRRVTAGCDRPRAGSNGFQKTVDVFGYNYKPMLYAKFHSENPGIPLYGSETSSAISSRGEYVFPVSNNKADGKIGFQMSSYDLYAPGWAMPPDTEFKGQDENPFVAGEFVWTGFDYIGEPTPYNDDVTVLTNFHTPEEKAKAEEEIKALGKLKVPSRSSYFGIIDLAGFKKDRFYLYQARWRPELPMAHILPHWNWQDRVGEITPVHVYTSGDEAELFLNGQSLGRKKKGKFEYRIRWDDVKYAPGELKVVAYKDGKPWATSSVKTTGSAAKLILTPDRAKITTDGNDLCFVTATVADNDGLMVPRSHPQVKFEITGPGEIVATDNGDATDLTSFKSTDRAAFNGLALAIVRAKPGSSGPITLRVTAEGLAPAEVIVNGGKP